MKMPSFQRVCFFVMLLVFQYPLQAQEWLAAFHVHENDSLPYRFLLPEMAGQNEKILLLIFLHGAGERGNDNQKQLIHGGAFFRDAVVGGSQPAMLVFPQCPEDDYWANIKKTRTADGSQSFQFFPGNPPRAAMQQLISLLDSLIHLDFIDRNRIYLGGLSMGGMGTFELLSRRPDVFAAAFPICGGGNPEAIKAFSPELKAWIFHGEADKVVLPAYSIDLFKGMQDAGFDVKISIYPEVGHAVWDEVFADPQLLTWLFSIKK
ncbi:MAG: prolyl oligopeptidase family serine peptidase [Bacteroidetes bacterium]|nr:prolyl oligopeptidase family serine peptidase [Bacteroidota bacterium]MBU1580937.1 prolyl oligopeptidase family serine peptidase [Bacteroidota bacterium]MBU2558381.1 prolyl oligopeptidase family serine peptidase [Bacteroidota bacterium]